MNKNILVFRSAQNFIVKDLIDSIGLEENNIYLIVQEEALNYFKDIYENKIKYITVNNGFFCYKDLKNNVNIKNVLNIKFDKILIPSSLEQFNGYEEIEKLILKFKYNEVLFYNKLGEFEIINVSFFKLFLRNMEMKYNIIFYFKLIHFSMLKFLRKILFIKYNNIVIIHIFATKAIGGSERRFLRAINYMYENGMNRNLDIYVMLQGKKNKADLLINKFCSSKNIKFIYTNDDNETLKQLKKYKPKVFHMTEFLEKEYKMFKLIDKLVANFVISITDTNKLYYEEYLKKEKFIKMIKMVKGIDCLYPSKVSVLKDICGKGKYITGTSNSFIDIEKFKPVHEKENTIIFAARMHDFKNPILALESINLSKDIIRKYNYKCLFLGEGPEVGKLMELIEIYKLDDIVEIKGYVDTSQFLSASKIFLSLQQVENYPSQSLLEAIACGNYIIASDVGDTKLILEDEFSALVELDANYIAQKLQDIIPKYENAQFTENIIDSSYAFSKVNFKIESFCKYLYEFWNKFN